MLPLIMSRLAASTIIILVGIEVCAGDLADTLSRLHQLQ